MGTVKIATGSRVYLDANVFIYVAEVPGAYPQLTALFARFAAADLTAVTSTLTLAEVLVGPVRSGDVIRRAGYEKQITTGPVLTVVDLGRDVLIHAATVRALMPRIKLPDAIHVATAELAGCDLMLTNDAKIGRLPRLQTVLIADLI